MNTNFVKFLQFYKTSTGFFFDNLYMPEYMPILSKVKNNATFHRNPPSTGGAKCKI